MIITIKVMDWAYEVAAKCAKPYKGRYFEDGTESNKVHSKVYWTLCPVALVVFLLELLLLPLYAVVFIPFILTKGVYYLTKTYLKKDTDND